MSHTLEFTELTKCFDTPQGRVVAVGGVSCRISGAEFFTMLGPSGCGKTTTLRMIAGLETITSGRILFDGADFTRTPASDRNIGMVFQSYALFPHMTVFENAAYGLRTRGAPGDKVRRKVGETLDLLGLGALAGRYPSDLSGGQQQRVSIARALAYEPGMLLLDEPLANLDAKLRVEMREEIRRIQKALGILTLYVTHDQEEALSVADRIAVFGAGRIMQVGAPQEVYDAPSSLFVADFIGKANLFPARSLTRRGDAAIAALPEGYELEVADVGALSAEEASQVPEGFAAMVFTRPESIRFSAAGRDGLPGRITRIQHLGSFVRHVVECPLAHRPVVVDLPGTEACSREGDAVSLQLAPGRTRAFLTASA